MTDLLSGPLTGDQIAGLVLMVILCGSLLGSLMRSGLGQSVRHAGVWALIFLGTIAAVGLWGDIRATVLPQQSVLVGGAIELPRQSDGHYYVDAAVNGANVRFVVDTGATEIVLNQADAAVAGLSPETLAYVGIAHTANGPVATAPVRLASLVLGQIETLNVRASVNQGALESSLLGMSYLSRFSSIEITGGKMILRP